MKLHLIDICVPSYMMDWAVGSREDLSISPEMYYITQDFIDFNDIDTEIPIKMIKNIYPFSFNRYWPDESLMINFKEPYDICNGHIRINQIDIMKLVNRKKKYSNIYLYRAKRYWYAKLKE